MKAIFDFRAWRNTMAPLLPASSAERIILPPSHATFARAASPPATSLCSGSTVTVPPLMVSRQQTSNNRARSGHGRRDG